MIIQMMEDIHLGLSDREPDPRDLSEDEKIEEQWCDALLSSSIDMPHIITLMSTIVRRAKEQGVRLEEYKISPSPTLKGASVFNRVINLHRFGFEVYTLPVALMACLEQASRPVLKGKEDDSAKKLTSQHTADLFKILFDQGLDLHLERPKFGSQWFQRVKMTPMVLNLLLDKGLDPNLKMVGDNSLMLSAASTGLPETVQCLLDAGANPKIKGAKNQTALMSACSEGATSSEKILELLIASGVPVNSQNHQGATALHLLCRHLNADLVSVLLRHHARCDLLDHQGRTVLHYAMQRDYASYENLSKLISMLIEHGLPLQAKDHRGHSALHLAVYKNNVEAVKVLIEHGVNVLSQSKKGQTALDVARQRNSSQEIIIILEQMERVKKELKVLSLIGKPIGSLSHHHKEDSVDLETLRLQDHEVMRRRHQRAL